MTNLKVLQVTAADITINKLLMPLIERQVTAGYEVHTASSDGDFIPQIRARGLAVHILPIARRISPLSNLRSVWRLYRLMKRERFDVVHVHTPVAAVLGRIAAWLAGVPVVIYTAHGFYYHERMAGWLKRSIISLEKALARITDIIFTQSKEDADSAIKEGVCPAGKVVWIGNGVDTRKFSQEIDITVVKSSLKLEPQNRVIGFVGRMVREKGILELLKAMERVIKEVPEAKLVMVGDTLSSDRDKNTRQAIDSLLSQSEVGSHVLFPGFRDDIPAIMQAFDVFVLPSYREGMPRSIIEAMASGKPVIATNIRGCREEVLHGKTGFLVPVGDSDDLAAGIIKLLINPELAQHMGAEGQRRARDLFDEKLVLDRQMTIYEKIIKEKLVYRTMKPHTIESKKFQLTLKRTLDVLVSGICLALLAIPFLMISTITKIDSRGPVFFRQERVGKKGKVFFIWKFRTMVDGAVNKGLGFTVAKDDDRITRFGKLLRDYGIDELPQLINVLTGDMSLVGPRPTLKYQVEQYGDFERQRLLSRPGITSLAVIRGRNLLTWAERIKIDVEYISKWSFALDLKIILATFWKVLVKRDGIYGADGVNDEFVPQKRIVQEELP